MEREKPLRLTVFLGCVIAMASLLLALALNLYFEDESGAIYRSQPLANLVGIILLILGLILMYVGSK